MISILGAIPHSLWRIGIILLFGLLAVWAVTLDHLDYVIANEEPWLWLSTFLINLGPELAGIVLAVVIIDIANERRLDEQFKQQLILQMASTHNDLADSAVRQLRARGWLSDKSLENAILNEASLEDCDLGQANLFGAQLNQAKMARCRLHGAILSEADLVEADLSHADLELAELCGSNLEGANLTGAILTNCKLRGARLNGVTLEDANLSRTDLTGAQLDGVGFKGVSLQGAQLDGASMLMVDLRGAISLSLSQLDSAKIIEGSTMPDGERLASKGHGWLVAKDGLTYSDWRKRYTNGGEVAEVVFRGLGFDSSDQ